MGPEPRVTTAATHKQVGLFGVDTWGVLSPVVEIGG
jgi:hypothetical protein